MKFSKHLRKIMAVVLSVMMLASVCAGTLAATGGTDAEWKTVVSLDFENSTGIACKNHGSDPVAQYAEDPEDPDNTVYYYSGKNDAYAWRGSAMFGARPNATTRNEGLVLQGGKTYTVSFRFKVGAGTTWDCVVDGPNAPDYNYRVYLRLTGVSNGFALGGNQTFGKEIKPTLFDGVEDTLLQTYMSEQLPDEWETAIEDINYDSPDSHGEYHPYYIIQSQEDTPWINYTTTFTCPNELNNTKLAMTLHCGVGRIHGEGTIQSWECNFYMDDVTIQMKDSSSSAPAPDPDTPEPPSIDGETKTATYVYNFRDYDAYDYMLGTENGFRVLGYGGTTDFTTGEEGSTVLDFWNNSSGPTPYGMIVGGSTDFFKDTGYYDGHGKLDIRGNNGGDPLNFYGGNGVVVKEGYIYEVSVTFVPLNLTNMNRPPKVAIALINDNESTGCRPIGTNFPNVGVYYANLHLRGRAEWPMTEKSNVYRYDKSLQGAYIKDDDFGYPVYENGIYLPEDPDVQWWDLCEQTLTATYQYGTTDILNGTVNTGDLGSHFGIMVGSQGAGLAESKRYLSQICVSDVTIKVTAPADVAEFEDGAVFYNGNAAYENGNNNPGNGGTTGGNGGTEQTGDTSNMVLWTTLLLASGAGIVTTSVYSRKRRYNR